MSTGYPRSCTLFVLLLSGLLHILVSQPALAQEGGTALVLPDSLTLARPQHPPDSLSRSDALRVFLDCDSCDRTYIRQHVGFVNYVRNRQQAQVHVFVTSTATGSGGRAYAFQFIGLDEFAELDFRLEHIAQQTDTWDEVRNELVRTLKTGLVPYVAQTPFGAQLDVSYEAAEQIGTQEMEDPWSSWIFEIGVAGGFEREQRQSEYNVEIETSADRVTRVWRIRNEFETRYEEDNFTTDEGKRLSSISRRYALDQSAVRSISAHWSIGAFSDVRNNTFNNTELDLRFAPALEFNLFPYRESSRRQFTFAYTIGPRYTSYIEETIFGKTNQFLVDHRLDVTFDMDQPWGSIYANVRGSHYFHDITKNRVEMETWISLRLVKGLALRLSADYQIIHDQLYLPQGDASLEEILLQRQQLATTYELRGSIGLSYTFGSIYNNVVNTRL